jgi:hypothetical protein
MLSLRDLFDHTLKNYYTYIRAYLDYLQNILHKPWDDTHLPTLRFDMYLPYCPLSAKDPYFHQYHA